VFNIEYFVTDICKTIKPKFDENQNVQLLVECDSVIKTVYSDRYRLIQILLNYLTNALKFTERGSITIRVRLIENQLEFAVTDTGRGIPEEKKRVIFEPFSQTNITD